MKIFLNFVIKTRPVLKIFEFPRQDRELSRCLKEDKEFFEIDLEKILEIRDRDIGFEEFWPP